MRYEAEKYLFESLQKGNQPAGKVVDFMVNERMINSKKEAKKTFDKWREKGYYENGFIITSKSFREIRGRKQPWEK